MKRLTLFVVLALFIQITVSSQPCLPNGIEFNTQAQIDSFQIIYPGCSEIEGDVEINGDDITNLNGLNVVTSIGGYLLIYGNDSLTTLTGLDNVTSVGGYLRIKNNHSLTSLTGLDNVTSIGGSLAIGELSGNPNLTSLTGLEGLTSIGGYLSIWDNYALTSLTGLDNLISIGGGANYCRELFSDQFSGVG